MPSSPPRFRCVSLFLQCLASERKSSHESELSSPNPSTTSCDIAARSFDGGTNRRVAIQKETRRKGICGYGIVNEDHFDVLCSDPVARKTPTSIEKLSDFHQWRTAPTNSVCRSHTRRLSKGLCVVYMGGRSSRVGSTMNLIMYGVYWGGVYCGWGFGVAF